MFCNQDWNNNVVRVMDFYNWQKTDSQIIDECLKFSSGFTSRTIVFDRRDWNIDQAILLQDNTTVIVDGVMIKQNNLMFDNIFRGDNFEIDPQNPNGFPLKIRPITNIRIMGKNGAKLEGPDILPKMMHPTMGNEQEMVGDYWGWRNFQVCLSRCTNFELAGFTYTKPRSWANSFDRCSYGYIHDLDITSTVKNGDGVNIRLGCNNIVIDHIKGHTSDDLVAINSMTVGISYPSSRYVYPLDPSSYLIGEGEDINERDIYNIIVSNVLSSTSLYSHGVALLSRNGHKIYNIHIHDIIDGNPVSSSNRLAVIGSYKGYSSGYVPGDMHNIRINHVVSNSAKKAIVFNDPVKDVWINHVIQNRVDGVVLDAVDSEGITVTNSK
ncbi:MAG TPA: hypothetical protein DDZ89_07620 [Clostridiales bacterium]|nr:hypothetical protein [Clostridiales bacterium]